MVCSALAVTMVVRQPGVRMRKDMKSRETVCLRNFLVVRAVLRSMRFDYRRFLQLAFDR